MIKPLLGKIYDLSFINFDVAHLSNVWMERFSFLDINYMILFFTFIFLIIDGYIQYFFGKNILFFGNDKMLTQLINNNTIDSYKRFLLKTALGQWFFYSSSISHKLQKYRV